MDDSQRRGKQAPSGAQGPFCPLPIDGPDCSTKEGDHTDTTDSHVEGRSSLFGAPLRLPSARPLAAAKPVGSAVPPTTSRDAPPPELQINMLSYLIVDDVIPSCHVAQTILRALGVAAKKIFIANNLHDAYRLMRSAPIQVIISDLNLTDGSGLDLLHCVRSKAETRQIPFVLVTNTPELQHITEAKDLGVSSCLVKPISVASLRLHIEYAIRASQPSQFGGSFAPSA